MIDAKSLLKKGLVSFCVSAGVLSIANIETIWREESHRGDYADVRRESRAQSRAELRARWTAPKGAASATGPATELRESLSNVEIGEANPFAKLSTLKPLDAVLNKGISSFKRQAYRSPNYKEESGYDLVAYHVTHPDQTSSVILAYLERTLEGPDAVPVVLVVSNGPEHASQALFRSGELTESAQVPLSVAQGMVAQRLNAGVPFLSVAR